MELFVKQKNKFFESDSVFIFQSHLLFGMYLLNFSYKKFVLIKNKFIKKYP